MREEEEEEPHCQPHEITIMTMPNVYGRHAKRRRTRTIWRRQHPLYE
jgi:hypothetical protein